MTSSIADHVCSMRNRLDTIESGETFLKIMEEGQPDGRTKQDVFITKCGELKNGKEIIYAKRKKTSVAFKDQLEQKSSKKNSS